MLETVIQITRAAGLEILRHYENPIQVDYKADNSPLTIADKAAHILIVTALRREFHSIPVLSEESPPEDVLDRRSWKKFWLVDPLDGTKEFIKRTGSFTVNIALIERGRPVLGVVHVPVTGETWWAERGEGAWRQRKDQDPDRLSVRRTDLSHPVVVASQDHAGPGVEQLLRNLPGAKLSSMGSSLKFCLVAAGEADVYLRDLPTMEWDTAAAQCIVEEAGGKVVDLNASPLAYNKSSLKNPPVLTYGDDRIDWLELCRL